MRRLSEALAVIHEIEVDTNIIPYLRRINYLAAGLCLIAAIVTPLTIDIMHGFEGQAATATNRVFAFILYAGLSVLFWFIARHNIFAVAIMVSLYLVMVIAAKSLFPLILIYVVVTSLPFLLTFRQIYAAKNT